MQDLLDWIANQGAWAPTVFILSYIGAAVAFIPGSLLTLSAGALFGVVKGTIIVSLASTSAAAVSFLLGRYTLRTWIQKKLSRNVQFKNIDDAISNEGWKIVFLLRRSPLFPFALLNYGIGLTSIRFWPAIIASWVGMLPGTILYVYLGSLAQVATQETTTAQKALYAVGLLATLTATILITKIAKRALSHKIDIAPNNNTSAEPK